MATLMGKDTSVVESLDESLGILQPEKRFIEINGDKIFVNPFTFGKLLTALKYIANLQDILSNGQAQLEENLLRAISEHGQDVLALISLSTDLPVEYFDTIPSDKGLDLAILTYEVNESFFAQNLLPKLQGLFPSDSQIQEDSIPKASKSKKAGSTSSKS